MLSMWEEDGTRGTGTPIQSRLNEPIFTVFQIFDLKKKKCSRNENNNNDDIISHEQ